MIIPKLFTGAILKNIKCKILTLTISLGGYNFSSNTIYLFLCNLTSTNPHTHTCEHYEAQVTIVHDPQVLMFYQLKTRRCVNALNM